MTDYVPGMLSLSYHVVFDDAVQSEFRNNWVGVATQFAISDGAQEAIAAATRRGTYSADDARAICGFMDSDIREDIDVSAPEGNGSDAPPPGMLSATYHVFAAQSGTPLSAFDLTAEEAAAIENKDMSAIANALYEDFNQRYEAVYTLAW